MSEKQSAEQFLVDRMFELRDKPYEWVMYAFPWGEPGSELAGFDGPDEWQEALLLDIESGLKTVNEVLQLATMSGNGVGKSCLVAWLILWAMSTAPDTRGVVTANTDAQLRTKTWPELAKWYRLCIVKHWFKYEATSLFSVDKAHEKTWRFDMIPWSKSNPEAFAGMHNKGKRILIIFDEASGIENIIWETTEGALTDEDTQIIWAVFGNGTRNTGRFFDCFNRLRHRWICRHVDSRSVKVSNKTQLDEWLADYGEDSDFVRVHVKGLSPASSSLQFIPTDLVDKAKGKHLRVPQYDFAPKIIGIDNAWTGAAQTVIVLRQGLMSKVLGVYPKNEDDVKMAGILARFDDENKADAVFIDFGYGTGLYSFGKNSGREHWHLINFGGESSRADCLNKRAEMWSEMKQWLKDGGALPPDEKLAQDLIGPEAYIHIRSGRLQIEKKEDMEKRGLPSPDRGDALALTFALPVQKRSRTRVAEFGRGRKYDPFDSSAGQQDEVINSAKYDPF